MRKRVTIKDVASLADVSYQTVSRVINNSDNVRHETRERVQAAIAQLNYRPQLAARSLSGRLSYVIGFIIPYTANYLIRDPNLLAQISSIDAVAHERDYSLLLAMSGNGQSGIEAYHRFFHNHVADGAIVIETASSREGNPLLRQQNYPFVVLGYDLGDTAVYSIHSDDYNGARIATNHLIEQGHQRIGIINGPEYESIAALQARLDGHQAALAAANIPFAQHRLTYGDFSRQSGYTAAQHLFNHPTPPTAVFAFNDRMAMGAIQALQQAGLRVPQDVAVIGFDDIPEAAYFNPPLTTIQQPVAQLGQLAARQLFNLIDGNAITNREVIRPVQLIKRQSA